MPPDEKSAVELVAGLMALSARTAPKGWLPLSAAEVARSKALLMKGAWVETGVALTFAMKNPPPWRFERPVSNALAESKSQWRL